MTTMTADSWRWIAGATHGSPPSGDVSAIVSNELAATRNAASRAASSLPARALADLARIARECSANDWDGHGAKAIPRAACSRAEAFITDLPQWMPAPDLVPEADGEIAIEWYVADNQTFSVSIGAHGPLHYAGLFGHEDEVHGVKAFDGVAIPDEIFQLVCKVLKSSSARQAA